jgi:hypothetical protein
LSSVFFAKDEKYLYFQRMLLPLPKDFVKIISLKVSENIGGLGSWFRN